MTTQSHTKVITLSDIRAENDKVAIRSNLAKNVLNVLIVAMESEDEISREWISETISAAVELL